MSDPGWIVVIVAILILPYLLFDAYRLTLTFPIDPDEGWNCYHTARLMSGGPLYTPITGIPLIPVNYPPVSFIVTGLLSHATGSVLLTGRLIAFAAFLLVGYFIYAIIRRRTSSASAALLGAVVWYGLVARAASNYVGMFDPQMLAHAIAIGALCRFLTAERLSAGQAGLLGVLCSCALFIKYLLIPVPLVIAISLWARDRRNWWVFTASGLASGIAFLGVMWMLGHENVLSNFIEFIRPVSNASLRYGFRETLIRYGILWFFLPFTILAWEEHAGKTGRSMSILLYFGITFLLAIYTCRGLGVDTNAWFDFFIASALVLGIFASRLRTSYPTSRGGSQKRSDLAHAVGYGVLLLGLFFILPDYGSRYRDITNYRALKEREQTFARDVARLRSMPGPTLFEDLLLGYYAGKPLLYEPFGGTLLIVGGKVPERIITEPIIHREFSTIVLSEATLTESFGRLQMVRPHSVPRASLVPSRWTDNTLRAIQQAYEPLKEHEQRSKEYFFVPRRSPQPVTAR